MDALLESAKAASSNCMGTMRMPMLLSDYEPPRSLASDHIAWNFTIEEPYCKRFLHFPQRETRWISASTHSAFGEWIEESHGFCLYLNVLAGSVWVVISKPKVQGGHPLTDFSYLSEPFHPIESNSALWNVEAILVGEGSQL